MELDWKSFINFPKDIEDILTSPNFFTESGVNCEIKNTIISSNYNFFIELEVEPINSIIDNTNTFDYFNNNSNFSIYQYNLKDRSINCTVHFMKNINNMKIKL
ncbi:hypothetical protein RhiirB3_448707 [Rhizophagus irregularis]|nr:hypothetical protein RhiirB3_448707 [Rhizophagus irregularis]